MRPQRSRDQPEDPIRFGGSENLVDAAAERVVDGRCRIAAQDAEDLLYGLTPAAVHPVVHPAEAQPAGSYCSLDYHPHRGAR